MPEQNREEFSRRGAGGPAKLKLGSEGRWAGRQRAGKGQSPPGGDSRRAEVARQGHSGCRKWGAQAHSHARANTHVFSHTCTRSHTDVYTGVGPHPYCLTFVPHPHTPFHVHAHTYTPANTKDKCGGTRVTPTHPVTPYTSTLHTHKHARTLNTHTGACSFRSPPPHSLTQCAHPHSARLPPRTRAHVHSLTLAVCGRSPTRRRTRGHRPAPTHSRSPRPASSHCHVTDPSGHFQNSWSFDKSQRFHLARELANLRLPPPPHSITRLK